MNKGCMESPQTMRPVAGRTTERKEETAEAPGNTAETAGVGEKLNQAALGLRSSEIQVRRSAPYLALYFWMTPAMVAGSTLR